MDFRFNQTSFPFRTTALAAHNLADLLKRLRPAAYGEIEQLQSIVVRAHQRLEESHYSPEIASAWCDLNAAFHTLNDLKRHYKS